MSERIKPSRILREKAGQLSLAPQTGRRDAVSKVLPVGDIKGPDNATTQPRSVDRQPVSLLHAATRLIIDVSKTYPASVVVQAAAINLACREKNLQPSELGEALLGDEGRLGRLAKFANSRHKEAVAHSGVTVDLELMIKLVKATFGGAYLMMPLPSHLVQGIIDDYPTIRSDPNNEIAYRKLVGDMIKRNNS